jgi:hypothetical protein
MPHPRAALRRLAAVAALAGASVMGASCFLPDANITTAQGSGGSGSSFGLRPVDGVTLFVPPTGPRVSAPSGTAMQRHLVFANRWWLFYLTGSGLVAQSSPDFRSWTPPPTEITSSTGIPLLVAEPVDGRSFGIDTQPLDDSDSILHVGLTGLGGKGSGRQHARALVGLGTLSFDPVSDLSGVVAPPDLPDGTVTVLGIGSPHVIVDFASVGTPGASGGACAQTAGSPDDGGAWDGAFSAPLSLDVDGGSSDVTLRGGLALDGRIAMVWRDGTAIRYAGLVEGPTPAGRGTLGDPGDGGAPVARTFAACAQPPVPQEVPARVHVLSWGPGGFVYHSSTDGQSWESFPPPGPPFGGVVGELFLACGPDGVYAFTIDPSDQRIRAARWDEANNWSNWDTAVTPVAVTPLPSHQRCFLSGYDRVAPAGIGLLWTEADDCAASGGSTPELHGALVPLVRE